MKVLALWLALIVAIAVAASVSVVHFKPVSSALKQFVMPGPLSLRHAYLGDQCAACHEPGDGVTVAKCTACHAADDRLLGRQPTAFHASIAECSVCHVEHQGASVRPHVMDHLALAQVGARALARVSRQDLDSLATLKSLETWLRVSSLGDLDLASAHEVLNCAGCHDRRDPHFKQFGSDCAQCHRTESWTVAGYMHPSPSSKECVQCHLPPPSHRMEHFAMVSQQVAHKQAPVDQCFACHLTTSWNDIDGVGFYKHH
jgi:hypothetical protein